jgi:hypothetical protein
LNALPFLIVEVVTSVTLPLTESCVEVRPSGVTFVPAASALPDENTNVMTLGAKKAAMFALRLRQVTGWRREPSRASPSPNHFTRLAIYSAPRGGRPFQSTAFPGRINKGR